MVLSSFHTVYKFIQCSYLSSIYKHYFSSAVIGIAGFVKDSVLWRTGDIELSGWELDASFPEVPARLLDRKLWVPHLWGKWKHEEGILTLEAWQRSSRCIGLR